MALAHRRHQIAQSGLMKKGHIACVLCNGEFFGEGFGERASQREGGGGDGDGGMDSGDSGL
jgi:hypothetical protein